MYRKKITNAENKLKLKAQRKQVSVLKAIKIKEIRVKNIKRKFK